MSLSLSRSLLTRTLARSARPTTRPGPTALRLPLRAMSFAAHTKKTYENILTSAPAAGVALITLNRPKALNALCAALVAELNDALDAAERDDAVGAVVLTGSERAFAAGADIKEMKDKEFDDVYKNDFLANWHRIAAFRKPTIAAVSGYALGGGCELALMCDILLAAPSAVFGQPEINLGVIPGAGGTQRLARALGKARAMELVLTGATFGAADAARWGVAARVVEGGEPGEVVRAAVELARVVAGKGRLAVQAGKESVNAAFELPLADGLRFERRLFHGLFATPDQKEGMAAFVEKRKPKFAHL
ncbi:enoyl-CoA hydratase [Phellopilus nigrolimitatus]|nr:enoyl-CoA hydratase [Phellopilus nigrolimitatus]